MDLDFLQARDVILANGDRLSLQDAALNHMRLSVQLPLEEEEWDVVYHLREICLGRLIDSEPNRFLIATGWLREDGTPDPALKSVVLSSVRGEGRLLHLESPYTDPLDRALADFFISREQLLSQLDPAETPILFQKPSHERAFDKLRDEFRDDQPRLPLPPPPSGKSFVDELNERLKRPPSPDSPPPPPK